MWKFQTKVYYAIKKPKRLFNIFFILSSDVLYGNHFEGDMILNQEQLQAISAPVRNGLISSKYRWPNRKIPYQLSSDHSKQERNFIESALKTIESVSCVKFVRRINEQNFVNVTVSIKHLMDVVSILNLYDA